MLFFLHDSSVEAVVEGADVVRPLPAWDKTFLVGVYKPLHGRGDSYGDSFGDNAIVGIIDRDRPGAVYPCRVGFGYNKEAPVVKPFGDRFICCHVRHYLLEDGGGYVGEGSVGGEGYAVWARGGVFGFHDDIMNKGIVGDNGG
jgi:hypothetical protein